MKRIIGIALVLAASGCNTTTTPTVAGAVQVSFATQPAPAASMSQTAMASDTMVTGADTLVLTSVEVVLRQIELKAAQTTDCAGGSGGERCAEVQLGPVLVNLPLTPGAEQRFALDSVPYGAYGRLEFEVHKPDDGDPQDQAFINANPAFAQISLRVRGTFNGQAFEFTSDLDAEQELTLAPELSVVGGASVNVTIFVDVSTWFLVNGTVVNPATANRSTVEQNIKNSFQAFEDEDRSGTHDD
jgi:hypothetical protein